MIVHASLAARRLDGRWRGALLRGASGAGKSDLMLRLVDAGWRLVADDRVRLWTSGEALFGAAPEALSGLVEMRGQGLAQAAPLRFARVACVVDLGAPDERQPRAASERLCGVDISRHILAPLEASAPARLLALLADGL